VERLLAKKAVRKTRKAQEAAAAAKEAEMAAANASVPFEAPFVVATVSGADVELATTCTADDSIVAHESTAKPNSAEEEPFPSKGHREESDSGSTSTDEVTRQKSGFGLRRRTSRWADDESGKEWELDEEERQQLFADLDEEECSRLLGEFPATTDDDGSDWDGAWSDDEEDEANAAAPTAGVKPSVVIGPRPMADESFPTSRAQSRRRSRRSCARKRRRNKAKKPQVNDDWMTPFSELFRGCQGGQPAVLPMPGQPMAAPPTQPLSPTGNSISPAVCIWNTTSSSAAKTRADGNPQDVFTDGSQVFQRVPSTNGQPLFTDGKQLYASVCVMLGATPSSKAGGAPLPEPSPEPSSMLDNCGTVDEYSVANLISYMATSDEEDWD